MNLVSLLAAYVGTQVERSVKGAVSPLAPYLRKLATGVAFIVAGLISLVVVLIALAAAMFFGLAELPYWSASLWTAGVFAFLTLIAFIFGFGALRRPR